MKFVLVDTIYNKFENEETELKPFLINVAFIKTIEYYDENIHSSIFVDADGKKTRKAPSYALNTIFVDIGKKYHLCQISSKNVLAALNIKDYDLND